MQLAQMVVEVVEVLPAAPEGVFALLTDVERMAGLGPEHGRAQWEGRARGVGAVFRGWNARDGRAWEVPNHVVEHEPPSRFAWSTGDPATPSATWSYVLTQVAGGTEVTQVFRHGPGATFLRRVVDKHPEREQELVAGRAAEIERNMRTVLRGAAGLLRDDPA